MCVLSGDVASLQINRCQATGANTLTHTYAHAPICQSFTVVPAGKGATDAGCATKVASIA